VLKGCEFLDFIWEPAILPTVFMFVAWAPEGLGDSTALLFIGSVFLFINTLDKLSQYAILAQRVEKTSILKNSLKIFTFFIYICKKLVP
jgi:hypothetical protein